MSVSVHDCAHHLANTLGCFCSRSLFCFVDHYSLDSASLYMSEQPFVCGGWFRLYLIFKDGSPTVCMVFGVSGQVFTYMVKLPLIVVKLDFTLSELPCMVAQINAHMHMYLQFLSACRHACLPCVHRPCLCVKRLKPQLSQVAVGVSFPSFIQRPFRS